MSVIRKLELERTVGLLQDLGVDLCPVCKTGSLDLRVDAEGLAILVCEGCDEGLIWMRLKEMAAERSAKKKAAEPEKPRRGWSARELIHMEIPERMYAIEGLVGEGANLLVGAPKIGKSWAAMGFGRAVATRHGKALGSIPCTHGDVLCLSLEDTPWRLKYRLRKILQGEDAPEGLDFFVEWPRLNEGGLEAMEKWVKERANPRLIIIDTLQKIRAIQRTEGVSYANDYQEMASVKALADKYRISILMLHHTNRTTPDDPFNRVSGTNAITGGVDATLLLDRERNSNAGVLHVTGRDVEERTLNLCWNPSVGEWTVVEKKEPEERERFV